jgi:hypothetical protein
MVRLIVKAPNSKSHLSASLKVTLSEAEGQIPSKSQITMSEIRNGNQKGVLNLEFLICNLNL